MVRLWLPLLAHCCFIVSISTPESLAFLMADVARGQPDKLEVKKKQQVEVSDEDIHHLIQKFVVAFKKWKKRLLLHKMASLVLCMLARAF